MLGVLGSPLFLFGTNKGLKRERTRLPISSCIHASRFPVTPKFPCSGGSTSPPRCHFRGAGKQQKEGEPAETNIYPHPAEEQSGYHPFIVVISGLSCVVFHEALQVPNDLMELWMVKPHFGFQAECRNRKRSGPMTFPPKSHAKIYEVPHPWY